MSVRDIPVKKLVAIAKYLDGFPPLAAGQNEEDVEQYYCLLCAELPRLPHHLGAKFTFSRSEITDFGMATVRDESPSMLLLRVLQTRGLPFDAFVGCLERIHCQGALNEFAPATRPEIVVQPQTQHLREGDTLCLECHARCKPGSPSFFWFRKRDNDPSPDWEPLTDSSSNRLAIEDVNKGHTGGYVCRATNPNINDPNKANVFSGEARVEVLEKEIQQKTPIRQETETATDPPAFPPVVMTQPESVTVEYGQPVTLNCQASGNNITYDWFRDGEYVSTHSDAVLQFKQAKLEHGGRYHCKMTNPQGGSILSNTVTLTVVPVIVIDKQPPKSFQGDRNEKIRLECSAHSRGPVVYQWFKNKKAICGAISGVYEDTLKCRSSGVKTYSLHCQVSLRDNTHSMISTVTRVTINLIKITMQPRDVHGEIGGSVTLKCKASIIGSSSSTNQIMEYIWLKSDHKGGRKEPLQAALKAQLSEGGLLFDGLKVHHKGFYVCQACYMTEFVESNEVELSVAMSGALPAVVHIVRQPVSWVVASGGSFRMRCKAVVTPPQTLQYQWFKNSSSIPNETSCELKRTHVTDNDYATYYCEVRTEDGNVTCNSESAYTEPAPKLTCDSPNLTQNRLSEGERKLFTLSEQRYAREKVALLIGNQKYKSQKLDKLQHTENEIRDVAKKLRELHFKVFTFVNLTLNEMDEVIKWFCGLLSAGVYGLFYYSGHGFSSGPTSYLMPVDSPDGAPDKRACIATDYIGNTMQRTLCRAILVLDCCRVLREDSIHADTPFESMNVSNITEIHSTGRGNVAYESSFSPSFIAALDKNDDIRTLYSDIQDRMEGATIWNNGSMNDKITLKDPIMRDDMNREREAERICRLAEEIQALPRSVTLTGPDLRSLTSLLSLTLNCQTPFTNVLTVEVELNLRKLDISPSLKLDTESLRNKGVEAELDCEDESLHYKVTIRNIQRLKEKLALPMVLTVHASSSENVCEQITHTFPEPPLSAYLKSSCS